MSGIYLLLGTNLGDRLKNLEEARRRIGTVLRESGIYETAAWGKKEQPDFLNQVIEIESDLEPGELLQKILAIEIEMGRKRLEKWGKRVIDIDILFFKDVVLKTKELTIPHAEIQNRMFTLKPLRELTNMNHPFLLMNIDQLISQCEDPLEVKRLPLQH